MLGSVLIKQEVHAVSVHKETHVKIISAVSIELKKQIHEKGVLPIGQFLGCMSLRH